ncbi:MAG: ammonium transporter [Roseivivax sp.]|nr:ammonium transporter [Roseivivax sp.]
MLDIASAWILICSFVLFFMQAGFLCLEAGRSRANNASHVALKNLADLSVVVLVFWLAGLGLMFGESWYGLFGTTGFAPDGGDSHDMAILFFQIAFAATAVSIISGAVAERCSFTGYIAFSALVALLIYPAVGHAIWGGLLTGQMGWLQGLGFVDFAGGTVVHSTGGWAALAGALYLGPRLGRFGRDRPGYFDGHSVMLSTLGAVLLWVGWLGFNAGSALQMHADIPAILFRTVLGAASGMMVAALGSLANVGHVAAPTVVNGMLAGLVACTACVHAITAWEAVMIGAIGSVLAGAASFVLIARRIDDPVDAIPVHLVAGIWGTMALALYGAPEYLAAGGRGMQILVQLTGVLYCGAIAFAGANLILFLLGVVMRVRVSYAAEVRGLDSSEHAIVAPRDQIEAFLGRRRRIARRFADLRNESGRRDAHEV